jgi:aerobic-type carbon monoxide dehydrogenase small subunit (CoxS/CutS family)|nr:(2Fe-2S)-binding protein [Candidatus Krumholzibacteria bacterium]
MAPITLKVNGKTHQLAVDPETPLLWVLRDHLHLTGTKYSCGISECGACTVMMDNQAIRSCVTTAQEAQGHDIVTIEGLELTDLKPLQDAWISEEVSQCGYCQPGQLMTAAALLRHNPAPTTEEIDAEMSDVLCRCGTYLRIRTAVAKAAKEVRS